MNRDPAQEKSVNQETQHVCGRTNVYVFNCFHGATLNDVHFSNDNKGQHIYYSHVSNMDEAQEVAEHVNEFLGQLHEQMVPRKRQKTEQSEKREELAKGELLSTHVQPEPAIPDPVVQLDAMQQEAPVEVLCGSNHSLSQEQVQSLLVEENEVFTRLHNRPLTQNDPFFYFNDMWLSKLVRENKYRLVHYQYKVEQDLPVVTDSAVFKGVAPKNCPYVAMTFAQCTQCSLVLPYKGKKNPRKNDGNALSHARRHEKKAN
ncbi:hypothetical protein KL918_003668 [Ogataea parapolymorpha]|uniref:Uncharacterized protein n=1 Tax=Ogataea parapolymorpha (strain ATCC 26012 / BCRC 20466 / JCM 22074 / NRRL Y-7560 / DL-1) TaxID=871575 RepID=W1QIE4_OGAPD|nr:hypothetical protein HPODL_04885 [Ogataea parapolymorpha DL-1]ESX02125.1 hypothetical protein HPODL_04885 [Ogataea parapolymorpha DL-1]KAG7866203.1 hypothetical protein KL918_003668 [Ogataea parapolymorpha]KAG7871336.1 hypothetical protein KL916_004131 [Ogataea parapolymorpha]